MRAEVVDDVGHVEPAARDLGLVLVLLLLVLPSSHAARYAHGAGGRRATLSRASLGLLGDHEPRATLVHDRLALGGGRSRVGSGSLVQNEPLVGLQSR